MSLNKSSTTVWYSYIFDGAYLQKKSKVFKSYRLFSQEKPLHRYLVESYMCQLHMCICCTTQHELFEPKCCVPTEVTCQKSSHYCFSQNRKTACSNPWKTSPRIFTTLYHYQRYFRMNVKKLTQKIKKLVLKSTLQQTF